MIDKLLDLIPTGMVIALLAVIGILAWIVLTNTTNTALCGGLSNRVQSRSTAIQLCAATPNCILAVDDIQKYNELETMRKHHCEAAAREEAP